MPSKQSVTLVTSTDITVFLSGEFVKLGDFGLSKDMAGHTFTQTYVGVSLLSEDAEKSAHPNTPDTVVHAA